MIFPLPSERQCTELFSAKEKRIPKAIRGAVRHTVVVGMIKEHRGKLLVRRGIRSSPIRLSPIIGEKTVDVLAKVQ